MCLELCCNRHSIKISEEHNAYDIFEPIKNKLDDVFWKIGKYLIYIQNLLYILCFIKILFSLFFYEYEPSFMKDMAFTLPLLLALIVIPIIKRI